MPHRYAHVGIDALSPAQARKLIQGGRVKVKLGNHHKIHVTNEHAKRLHTAYKKGAGIMLELDPYACEINSHMHGEGIASKLKHAGHKVGKFVKHHKEQFRPLASSLREAGHQAIADASMSALEHGVDPNLVSAYGQLAHQGVGGTEGGSLKSFFRSPGMKVVRKALKPLGQMALNDLTALGQQGLEQGMSQASSSMGGFLGMGVPNKISAVRARAIKKGSALYPAGMGFF